MEPRSEDARPMVVTTRRVVADGVVMLELEAVDGAGQSMAWEPGAHIDLLLGDGLVRQYSLCGEVGNADRWRIMVRRATPSRGGSARIHDELHEGSPVQVRGPRNSFEFYRASDYLFIAGGIGITPLLPMIAAADASGASWRLCYGGRSAESMPFTDELVATHGTKIDLWPEDVRSVIDLAKMTENLKPGTLVYGCGPAGLLDALEKLSTSWAPGTLHIERFAPSAEPAAPRSAFEVEIASTGERLLVPADKTLLEVLEAADVPVLYSCAEGTCRTCETRVLKGDIDHRDSSLSCAEREAGEYMLICVSRAHSDLLILDL